jgi:hypothetical protein
MFPQSNRKPYQSIRLCNPKIDQNSSTTHNFLSHRSCFAQNQRQCSKGHFQTTTTCAASRDSKLEPKSRSVSTTEPKAPPPSPKTVEDGTQTPLKQAKGNHISSPQIFQKALSNPIQQPDLTFSIAENEDSFIGQGQAKGAGLASRYRPVKKHPASSPELDSPVTPFSTTRIALQSRSRSNGDMAKHPPSLGSRTLESAARLQQQLPSSPPSSPQTPTPDTANFSAIKTTTRLSRKPLPPLPRKPRSGTTSSNSSVTLRVFPPSPTSTLAGSSHSKSFDKSFGADKDLPSSPIAGSFSPLMLDAKEPVSFFDEDDDDRMGLVDYVRSAVRKGKVLVASPAIWKKRSLREGTGAWRKWLCCCCGGSDID